MAVLWLLSVEEKRLGCILGGKQRRGSLASTDVCLQAHEGQQALWMYTPLAVMVMGVSCKVCLHCRSSFGR